MAKKQSELQKKLLGAMKNDHASTLLESKIFEEIEPIRTPIPGINLANSGELDGGLIPGFKLICGQSKHFKTLFGLLELKSFQQKYPDGEAIFLTNEFGSPDEYFKSLNIDVDTVVVSPFQDIEELASYLVRALNAIDPAKNEKVFILIDSIGSAASVKEIADTEAGESKTDMTRAKMLKALSRIILPRIHLKGAYITGINHIYMTMEMYSKAVVGGGQGIYLAADTIWIIGRQQEVEGTGKDREITGYNFIINIEKSRHVKEKSKIPITVNYQKGISRWSGMFDLAMDAGVIVSPTKGWYSLVDSATGEVSEKKFRRGDVEDDNQFWFNVIKTTPLKQWIKDNYKVALVPMVSDDSEDIWDNI